LPQLVVIKPNSYYDSVTLMVLAQQIAAREGVQEAVIVMATDMNKELLQGVGLLTPEAAAATGSDLVIAIKGETDAIVRDALAAAEAGIKKRPAQSSGGMATAEPPRTIKAGAAAMGDANLAFISVPGAYAAHAAHQALDQGLHVMLFSDNVPLEAEVALKNKAHAKGLLLMGPDCGTAMLSGVGLGFANAVKPGPIGVVAASGTGAQEFAALVDILGSGLTHIIGTGGRDLSQAVGGRMMLDGIQFLAEDEATKVIALVSKPPHPAVAERVIAAARATGKPVVQLFLGTKAGAASGNIYPVGSLTEAAATAVALATGANPDELRAKLQPPTAELQALAAAERAKLQPGQRYVRGLFCGGTLCEQAVGLLELDGRTVICNVHHDPSRRPADVHKSQGHTLVDLGDDVFTLGRPHPMMEPSIRNQRLLAEAADPEVAVILLDLVIGYGAHPDPAGLLAPVIAEARAIAARAGRHLSCVVSVTGTSQDPQGKSAQEAKLRNAGCLVLPTAAAAAQVAALITEGGAR
jgi:FdrA protein